MLGTWWQKNKKVKKALRLALKEPKWKEDNREREIKTYLADLFTKTSWCTSGKLHKEDEIQVGFSNDTWKKSKMAEVML